MDFSDIHPDSTAGWFYFFEFMKLQQLCYTSGRHQLLIWLFIWWCITFLTSFRKMPPRIQPKDHDRSLTLFLPLTKVAQRAPSRTQKSPCLSLRTPKLSENGKYQAGGADFEVKTMSSIPRRLEKEMKRLNTQLMLSWKMLVTYLPSLTMRAWMR